jgi:hypothetical protein
VSLRHFLSSVYYRFVYYESIKRGLKRRLIYWYRWDERLENQKWGIYTPLRHWVGRGTGRPKDKDEVKRREVWECEGWVWDLDVIDDPSMLRLIRKVETLGRIFPTLDLKKKPHGGSGKIHDLIPKT